MLFKDYIKIIKNSNVIILFEKTYVKSRKNFFFWDDFLWDFKIIDIFKNNIYVSSIFS